MSGTINAGAIDIVVTSDSSPFESSMSKIGATAERELKRVERAQANAKKEGEAFIASIQRQVNTFGLSGTALLSYEAKLKGVSMQAQPLIDKLNAMKAAQHELNQQTQAAGFFNLKRGFNEAGAAAQSAAHGTSGFTRELMVLTHEASQGQFKRFGGSLLVLSEYSAKAKAAIASMAGPVGVVVGALALFAFAAFEGAKHADELRNELILTGNYAGITAGSFDMLAKSVAASTSTTIGKAQDALKALVATGEVGPRQLAMTAEATVKLMNLTSKSADEIAKDFAKMAEGPTKWAAETNKAYNFLSVAQYDHIKRLEEEGKKEEAAIEVLARLNDHLGTKIPESLTGLGRTLHDVGLLWDGFWQALLHEGAPETIEDKLAKIEKNLKTNFDSAGKRVQGGAASFATTFDQGSQASLLDQRNLLLHDQLRQSEHSLTKAIEERYAKAGIAASDYFSKLREERKGADRLKKDLGELEAKIKARVAGGGVASDPEDAENRAFIRHRDRSFAEKKGESEAQKLATAVRERLQLYDVEITKLRTEGAEYVMYGKVLDKTAEAMARVEVATGKFAKASASVKNSIVERAKAEDRAAMFEKQAKADAAAAVTAAKAQEQLTKTLADQAIATDTQVEKLKEETKYLGLNTVERRIAIAQLEVEKQRRIELADPKNAGNEASINSAAADRAKKITEGLTEADDASKAFSFGAARTFKQYGLDANNAAKYAEQYIGGGLKHLEDALVNFVKTGKLNFTSLFSFMAEEFLRNQIRMAIAGNATSLTSGLGSLLGGGLGSVLGSIGGFFGVPLAAGMDYVPYDGFPAILHKGERVQTAVQARSGGGGISIDMSGGVTNVGQGVSRAEVSAAVQQANAMSRAAIMRSLKQQGVAA